MAGWPVWPPCRQPRAPMRPGANKGSSSEVGISATRCVYRGVSSFTFLVFLLSPSSLASERPARCHYLDGLALVSAAEPARVMHRVFSGTRPTLTRPVGKAECEHFFLPGERLLRSPKPRGNAVFLLAFPKTNELISFGKEGSIVVL